MNGVHLAAAFEISSPWPQTLAFSQVTVMFQSSRSQQQRDWEGLALYTPSPVQQRYPIFSHLHDTMRIELMETNQ